MRFADTSFWYALQDRRDRHHEEARAIVDQGVGRVVLSSHVLGETWTLMRRRAGHSAAVGFLDRLDALTGIEVVTVDEGIESDAWRWLRRHDEREYSFTDATSFALMKRRRIREA
ncbi:MAG: PIN domain-containing protein, partial [Candidatus Dormibacteraeota bacterium]|nr:PIN domain-containing protein [Candidatus Dormibacteraeota bacterium]